MPKVLRSGKADGPPAGLRARCSCCGEMLETTDSEPFAIAGRQHSLIPKGGIPGWYIPCPRCNEPVFFRE